MEATYSSCIDESLNVYEDMPVFRAAPNVISCPSFDMLTIASYDEMDVSPVDLKSSLSASRDWFSSELVFNPNMPDTYCVTSSVPTYFMDDVFPLAATHIRVPSAKYEREIVIERIQTFLKLNHKVIFCDSVNNFSWKCNASKVLQSSIEQTKFSINLYLVGDATKDSIVEFQRLKGNICLLKELFESFSSAMNGVQSTATAKPVHNLLLEIDTGFDISDIESTVEHLCSCAGSSLDFSVDSIFSVLGEVLSQVCRAGGVLSDRVRTILLNTLTSLFPIFYQKMFQLSTGFFSDSRTGLPVIESDHETQSCFVNFLQCMKWSFLSTSAGNKTDSTRPFIEFYAELQEVIQFSRCFAVMQLASELLHILLHGESSLSSEITPTATSECGGACSPVAQRSPSGVMELYPFIFSNANGKCVSNSKHSQPIVDMPALSRIV